jgi:hypothetical protein
MKYLISILFALFSLNAYAADNTATLKVYDGADNLVVDYVFTADEPVWLSVDGMFAALARSLENASTGRRTGEFMAEMCVEDACGTYDGLTEDEILFAQTRWHMTLRRASKF